MITDVNTLTLTIRGRAVPPDVKAQTIGAVLALKLLAEVRVQDETGAEVTFDDVDTAAVAHALSFVRMDNLVALGAHLARIAAS